MESEKEPVGMRCGHTSADWVDEPYCLACERERKATSAPPAPASERELRELVAKWRSHVFAKESNGEWAESTKRCADELERILTRSGQPSLADENRSCLNKPDEVREASSPFASRSGQGEPPYKGPITAPCSACSAGDTAMEYHDHEGRPRVPQPAARVLSVEQPVCEGCAQKWPLITMGPNKGKHARPGADIPCNAAPASPGATSSQEGW